MQNGAYRLAFLAALAGLLLLAVASPDGFETALGTVLLFAAVLLVGVGKAVDVLGYVRDGASEPTDRE